MRIWKNWDEEEKAVAVKLTGAFFLVAAIFVFISIVSYLFSWKQDASLLSEGGIMENATNAAGSLGFRTGHFLVSELFGIGSLALLIILLAISVRLLSGKWQSSLARTGIITLFGAFMASLALSYIGSLLGMETAFDGGLGGRCGAFCITWMTRTLGVIVTGLVIAVLIAIFLVLSSKKFSRWLSTLGSGKKKSKKKSKEPAVTDSDIEATPQEPDMPVVQDILPEEQPEPELESEPVEELPTEPQAVTLAEKESVPEGNFEIISDDSLNAEVTEELKPIDNRLDPPDGLPKYKFPTLDLLEAHAGGRREVSSEELTRNNNKIRAALANYKIQLNDVKAQVGPTVTLYKVYPAPGVKIADIKKLQEDIGMTLNARGVRVIQLSDCVGIEVANDYSSIVPLKALLNDTAFRESKAELPVAIGYTITQKVKVFDLADAPHLLVAGATKQGKSVGLNVIVSSLLYSKHPSELKFVFIDPKMVEFSSYARLLKHYLAVLPDAGSEEDEANRSIVKNPKDAEKILRSLCIEMDDRYELLSKAGVNNIKLYNSRYKERKLRPDHGHRYLPYIVVVVDEYADLTMTIGGAPEARAASRSITNSIIRLAQKGRAAGLHVILATQRPSVDVINGLIKSNFPMRIAFRVASRVDSTTIIDSPGAEKLIGKGDMLFSAGIESERIQCGFVSGDEIDSINTFISDQRGYGKCYNTPYYLPDVTDTGAEGGGAGSLDTNSLDERFAEAARLVVSTQKGSTSDLQRKLGMGYAKAGRVMDQLEAAGIVGPQEGSKPRQVLLSSLDELEPLLESVMKG
ncbi:MAG: DNA translocase FtsK 4TM domain-containing protein [Bacteroidales bacterium]|nr:DNA translocase FtsK 4TM domain-containing protein [Bacteroidales bacterium]